MKPKSILILGGYGITGGMIAQLLLQETDASLVIAGRSLEKATAKAAELNNQVGGDRVKGCAADAADVNSLQQAFQGMDMVIAASSTSQYVREVAGTALKTGLDYLDVQYATKKIMLKVEARGEKNDHPHLVEVALSHPNGYRFTAIPVVACLLQVLDSSRRKPGLWFQANYVEPVRFMKDIQRMGVEIQEKPVL
jgi:hypothetical protein